MNPTCRLVLCLVLLAQVATIFAEGGSYAHETPLTDLAEVPVEESAAAAPAPRTKPFSLPPVLNLLAPQSICDFLTYIQQVNQAFINNQVRMLNEIWSSYGLV